MKKILCAAIGLLFLFCVGCSPFGFPDGLSGGNDSGLADKLEDVARAPESTEAPGEPPEATAIPLPESISFDMLDPLDMLHEGWTLTREQAESEYGLESDDAGNDYYSGPVTEYAPGIGPRKYSKSFDPFTVKFDLQDDVLRSAAYRYEIDSAMAPEDVAAFAELMIQSVDQQFANAADGRSVSYYDEDRKTVDLPVESMPAGEILESVEDAGANEFTIVWKRFLVDGDESKSCDIELSFAIYGVNGGWRTLFTGITYHPQETPEPTPSPASEAAQAPAQKPPAGAAPAPQIGQVKFMGITTFDTPPPGEGILETSDFSATPNSSGGYNCSVTVYNVSYAMESSVYCLLSGADAIDLTLAESDWFDPGAAHTYSFEVPADMVASGDCEVLIEYTFW